MQGSTPTAASDQNGSKSGEDLSKASPTSEPRSEKWPPDGPFSDLADEGVEEHLDRLLTGKDPMI